MEGGGQGGNGGGEEEQRASVGFHFLEGSGAGHGRGRGQVSAGRGATSKSDSSDEKAKATGSGDVKAPEIKWVEMPLEYIAWVLGQKREEGLIAEIMPNDDPWKEEFFAFQEWVRDTFDQNGRVMVPEDFNGPNPGGLQDLIDEAWEKGKRELGMTDGCPPLDKEDDTSGAQPCN